MPIDVMLVDDHTVVRQGIKFIISQESDINIVAEASNGKEAVDMARQWTPDVIVMDITLPILNGLEASSQILKNSKKKRSSS
jgi:YesN/AraC family two-component response regulator